MTKAIFLLGALIGSIGVPIAADMQENDRAAAAKRAFWDYSSGSAEDLSIVRAFFDAIQSDHTFVQQAGYELARSHPQLWELKSTKIPTQTRFIEPLPQTVQNRYGTYTVMQRETGSIAAFDHVSEIYEEIIPHAVHCPVISCGNASDIIAIASSNRLYLQSFNGVALDNSQVKELPSSIRGIYFNHDDSLLLVAYENGTVSFFDCSSWEEVKTGKFDVAACAWEDDGSFLLYKNSSNELHALSLFVAEGQVTAAVLRNYIDTLLM